MILVYLFQYTAHDAASLSLETLLADTDEFDDDEHQFLIPPIQKSPPGFFSHKSHIDHNFNSTVQGLGAIASAPVDDSPTGAARSTEISSSQSSSLQPYNSSSLRTQECDSHCSVPSSAKSKGIITSQPGSIQSHDSALLSTQEHDNHYSLPTGTRFKGDTPFQSTSLQPNNPTSLRTQAHNSHYSIPSGARSKGISTAQSSSIQSQNSSSLRMHPQDSHYSVPQSRSGHKGAFKEVALSSGELHGSFKKVDEGSSTAAAQKSDSIPVSHPKAEPNHYIAPGELGLPRPMQVNVKSDATRGSSMVQSSQQMKQARNSAQVTRISLVFK